VLISPRLLSSVWGVAPASVLHVGGHEAEEDSSYRRYKWGSVVWVEALPDKALLLEERMKGLEDRAVINAVAWSKSGEMLSFNVADNGMSSSVFAFGTHSSHHPSVAMTSVLELEGRRLDDCLGEGYVCELVNLDVQGAELHALMGLQRTLRNARWIYTEVNTEEVYDGCALLGEIDLWLFERGFERVDLQMTRAGWGDALYIRSEWIPNHSPARRWLRRLLSCLGL
jgi:FkbM family methyltransferase